MDFKIEHMPIQTVETTNPFCDGRFYKLLQDSKSTGKESGWLPYFLNSEDSCLPGYIKSHSYGEYIFDWSWADFYERYQVPYYPKLVHAIPFTPVNATKIFSEKNINNIIEYSYENYRMTQELTGEHYLFINDEEQRVLSKLNFEIMHTIQYHWKNNWESMDHFLDSLKKGRRKMINKERRKVRESGVVIKNYQGSECLEIMTEVYKLYLSTIAKKKAYAYLQSDFFKLLPKYMDENLIISLAHYNGESIAMSIFIEGIDSLYGRYWGILPQYENEFPALHFEMCYYRGMDRCFSKGHKLFEAGAQGEHKLWRGFKPIKIYSAHHLAHKELFSPIRDYIKHQNTQTQESIDQLSSYLPYK